MTGGRVLSLGACRNVNKLMTAHAGGAVRSTSRHQHADSLAPVIES